MSAGDEVLLAQANERLRQERETFDQQKDQDARDFHARIVMMWVVICMLPVILLVAGLVLLFHDDFDPTIVKLAAGALLVDGLGMTISIYKSNVGRAPKRNLSPVTPQPGLPTLGTQGNGVSGTDTSSEVVPATEAS